MVARLLRRPSYIRLLPPFTLLSHCYYITWILSIALLKITLEGFVYLAFASVVHLLSLFIENNQYTWFSFILNSFAAITPLTSLLSAKSLNTPVTASANNLPSTAKPPYTIPILGSKNAPPIMFLPLHLQIHQVPLHFRHKIALLPVALLT